MKEDLRFNIWSVFDELCARDPEWILMYPEFKTLYQGWRTVELRHKVHSAPFYTLSWQRAWLPLEDGRRFRNYALQ